MRIKDLVDDIINEEPDFMFSENQNKLLRRFWRVGGDVKAESILRALRELKKAQ